MLWRPSFAKRLPLGHKCIDRVIIKYASNVTDQVKVTHRLAHKHIDQIRHKINFQFIERTNENDPIDPIHVDNVIALAKSLKLSPEPR